MYRPTSPQSSFFEPAILCPGFLPQDDWSEIFKEKIWPLLDEDKLKHLYVEEGGAPIKSIKLKLSLLIFMSLETLTWREAEYLFPRRLDWLNATHSPIGSKAIDHTTLFDFYQRLQEDDSANQLFIDLTQMFLKECGVSAKKQRTDSYFVHGWLAILSRYGLFKETIRSFLHVLRKHQKALYNEIKEELSYDYLKDAFDLTEKDKHRAQARVQAMAGDLHRLKTAFERHGAVNAYQTYQTLVTVFEQQCEIIETETNAEKTTIEHPTSKNDSEPDKPVAEANVEKTSVESATPKNDSESDTPVAETNAEKTTIKHPTSKNDSKPNKRVNEEKSENASISHSAKSREFRIAIRSKPLGDRIISSPHNTDAVYTRKRNQKVVGHKAFVTETCDPANPIQMITDVNLEVATHSDSKENAQIDERSIEAGFKPETRYGDAGFVNGGTILQSAEKGIALEGPSSGRSQSIEGFEKEDRPLDTADFEIDRELDAGQPVILACPGGHRPIDQSISSKTGKYVYHFDREFCSICPVASRCPVSIGKRVVTLTFDDKQHIGAIRHHHYMSDADYRKECAIRSGAESLVNEMANSHGTRKSRHRTEERSRLQLTFSAIACNIKRYVNFLGKNVQNPVATAETP